MRIYSTEEKPTAAPLLDLRDEITFEDLDGTPFENPFHRKEVPPNWFDPRRPRESIVNTFRDDPGGFVRHVLGEEPLPWQESVLQDYVNGERLISCAAGHRVGKSTMCCWAMIFTICTRFPQKTIITSPSKGQANAALLADLKMWIARLPQGFQNELEITREAIVLKRAPNESFIHLRIGANDKPESLSGVHSENVLVIVDEASAVNDSVFENALGTMAAPNATTILISNPTRNSGFFFDTWHRNKKTKHNLAGWKCIHVPSHSNPLVSEEFRQQLIGQYGEDSNQFRVRYLGLFPSNEANSFIPAELIRLAMDKTRHGDIMPDLNAPLVLGVDVARGGDRNAVCKRRGNIVEGFEAWRCDDLMLTADRIAKIADRERASEIMIDALGIGYGVHDILRSLGYPVRLVNVSESPGLNEAAYRLRDDLYMQALDWLRTRAVILPDSDELFEELAAPRFDYTEGNKLRIESKKQFMKRLKRSPDLADSFVLSFAARAARMGSRTARRDARGKIKRRNIPGLV